MHSLLRNRPTFITTEAALSFIGAGIAGTLWWADHTRQDVPCSAGGGCEIVNASRWSHVDLIFFHDVPVALLGLIGYIVLLSFAMLRFGTENPRLNNSLHRLLLLISGGGFAYSWYLQWVAYAKIGAYCPWCRASAITMTLLFVITAYEAWAFRRQPPKVVSSLVEEQSQRGQKIHG